jgi:hypothetical protein
MTFPINIEAAASPELPANENFLALKWAGLFGYNPVSSSGLVFGMHGGPMLVDGVLTVIADQTATCTVSTTNYVESTRAGVASVNTTGFTAGKVPLYVVTTSASGVASWVDWRTWHDLPGVAGRLSKSVAGSANVTLTAAEARNQILNFTGALTGSINVIVPNGPQFWTVSNNTTGAFTLTVKTAAGTGIAVTQGKAADLLSDGTNVILGNNDAAAIGGSLLAANNLSDVANAATARTNLGVDTAIAAAVAGLSWKQAVRAGTTANGTLATAYANGQTIDGVTLATGDRILIKNQSTGADNGIYVVAASGAPTRATDADSGAELVNASVYVSEGTTLADTQWTCTTNATITVDSTSLAFARLTSGGGITALTGDVTASGTGSVAATIANDAVSYAKMQNVSAASRLLGRGSAGGSGDPEELTAGGGLSILATVLQSVFLTNAQTGTTYAVVAGDRGKHVTLSNAASIAATIAQAGTSGFEDGYYALLECIGVGAVTLTPTTSTVNGAATLVLTGGMSALLLSDGANYRAIVWGAAGVAVNAQTGTSYTYLSGDRGKLVTHTNASAIAGTLPQATGAFGSTWFMWVQNRGAGTLTITPTTSTIDGAATLALTTGHGTLIASDGTNYYTMRGVESGSSSSALTVNSQSAAYTLVIGDANNIVYHPVADTTARTWTIPANSSVAFNVGTVVTFDNDYGAGAITIAITTDTLVFVGAGGLTGSRTLASGGQASAVKVTSTRWRINGTGLS